LNKRKVKEQNRQRREARLSEAQREVQLAEKPKPQPKELTAKTDNQLKLIRAIKQNAQVVTVGPAGTGKSYIPAAMAADMLRDGHIEKIVLCRPQVSVGKPMGFLPGDQDEKTAPWMIPLLEPIRERLGKSHVEYLLKAGKIEMAPIETMRGRTFKNSFVILDEAQNCTLHELKMIVTRIGEDSKLVIDGDIAQTDLKDSGLIQLVHLASKYNVDCVHVELGLEDIVRSGIVKEWLTAFYKEGL
jgi:phosphate starvation-inducible PhoH-like protein